MIRFFRTIRQRLLSENRASRYMLYALGEILLVVVGILIALQIDTWNETRKNNNTEQRHLREILTSLKRDQGRTRYIYNSRALRKKEALQQLMEDLHADSEVADTTLTRSFNTSLMTLSFTYDKGGYESLKAFGLDKISNDSLRPELVRFYEVSLPLAKVFLEEGKLVEMERRETLLQELRTFSFQQAADGTWYPQPVIDFAGLKDQEAFKELIALEMEVTANYIQRLERILDQFEWIIERVAAEIRPTL